MKEEHKLILQFIGSITLADHLGDVANDIVTVLKRIDFDPGEWDDLNELGDRLGEHGITTLHGSSLNEDDH